MSFCKAAAIAIALYGAGCASKDAATPPTAADTRPADAGAKDATMDEIAGQYVELVLATGVHDPDYVDAYYGPAEVRAAAERNRLPLVSVRERARALVDTLRGMAPPAGEIERLRLEYLARQLEALVGRVNMLVGEKMTFDQESRVLYDAVTPPRAEADFKAVIGELDRLLPGDGPLIGRYEAFTGRFVIPRDRLDAVFTAAIAECRRRTLPHVGLPEGETFTVEYVTGKPWSAYNWYQGNFRSVIQVNTDLPVYIDRAIDLACHEGYPGHHVYNALLEKHLVRERGWKEFTVYPLFSPQSLIAEGTANYGIEVAFPGDERVRFEREKLYPLAGLDPARAAEYDRVRRLVEKLTYAGNEAARRYLEGTVDAAQAASWLEQYALMPRARAEQRIRFFDKYRSYVINYNLGQDMVRAYVESKGGTAGHPDVRWREFVEAAGLPAPARRFGGPMTKEGGASARSARTAPGGGVWGGANPHGYSVTFPPSLK